VLDRKRKNDESCWLVEPTINAVTVYSSTYEWKAFINDEVVDEKIDIRIPINEIFA
jgi:hypothetical protein